MKRTVIFISMLVAAISLSGCQNNSTKSQLVAENKTATIQDSLKLDNKVTMMEINIKKSVINWKGSMLFSFGQHNGTVNFKEGYVQMEKGKISGGKFVVEMNSIVDENGSNNSDLVSHLKNEDFFEVEKYPDSKLVFKNFEYVDINRMKIEADITIKGITKSIILYNVDYYPNELKISTKFKIDRTDFGVNYSSKGLAEVKDHAISDAIELEVIVYIVDRC